MIFTTKHIKAVKRKFYNITNRLGLERFLKNEAAIDDALTSGCAYFIGKFIECVLKEDFDEFACVLACTVLADFYDRQSNRSIPLSLEEECEEKRPDTPQNFVAYLNSGAREEIKNNIKANARYIVRGLVLSVHTDVQSIIAFAKEQEEPSLILKGNFYLKPFLYYLGLNPELKKVKQLFYLKKDDLNIKSQFSAELYRDKTFADYVASSGITDTNLWLINDSGLLTPPREISMHHQTYEERIALSNNLSLIEYVIQNARKFKFRLNQPLRKFDRGISPLITDRGGADDARFPHYVSLSGNLPAIKTLSTYASRNEYYIDLDRPTTSSGGTMALYGAKSGDPATMQWFLDGYLTDVKTESARHEAIRKFLSISSRLQNDTLFNSIMRSGNFPGIEWAVNQAISSHYSFDEKNIVNGILNPYSDGDDELVVRGVRWLHDHAAAFGFNTILMWREIGYHFTEFSVERLHAIIEESIPTPGTTEAYNFSISIAARGSFGQLALLIKNAKKLHLLTEQSRNIFFRVLAGNLRCQKRDHGDILKDILIWLFLNAAQYGVDLRQAEPFSQLFFICGQGDGEEANDIKTKFLTAFDAAWPFCTSATLSVEEAEREIAICQDNCPLMALECALWALSNLEEGSDVYHARSRAAVNIITPFFNQAIAGRDEEFIANELTYIERAFYHSQARTTPSDKKIAYAGLFALVKVSLFDALLNPYFMASTLLDAEKIEKYIGWLTSELKQLEARAMPILLNKEDTKRLATLRTTISHAINAFYCQCRQSMMPGDAFQKILPHHKLLCDDLLPDELSVAYHKMFNEYKHSAFDDNLQKKYEIHFPQDNKYGSLYHAFVKALVCLQRTDPTASLSSSSYPGFFQQAITVESLRDQVGENASLPILATTIRRNIVILSPANEQLDCHVQIIFADGSDASAFDISRSIILTSVDGVVYSPILHDLLTSPLSTVFQDFVTRVTCRNEMRMK